MDFRCAVFDGHLFSKLYLRNKKAGQVVIVDVAQYARVGQENSSLIVLTIKAAYGDCVDRG